MDTKELLDIARELQALGRRLEAIAATEPEIAYSIAPEPAPAADTAEPAPEAGCEPEPAPVNARSAEPLPITFSLNDRYRFRRGLFGGSDEAMSLAVGRIADMHSAEEVEHYLAANDFDLDDDLVKDFLRITTRRFDSHPPLLA